MTHLKGFSVGILLFAAQTGRIFPSSPPRIKYLVISAFFLICPKDGKSVAGLYHMASPAIDSIAHDRRSKPIIVPRNNEVHHGQTLDRQEFTRPRYVHIRHCSSRAFCRRRQYLLTNYSLYAVPHGSRRTPDCASTADQTSPAHQGNTHQPARLHHSSLKDVSNRNLRSKITRNAMKMRNSPTS